MITYLKGDIFRSPAQVLVNTVNTVGVMGKGVALEFKKRYPDMFKKYQKVCDNKSLDVGKLMLWKGQEKWVLLFPTKEHWKNPSKIEYIESGLQKFVETYAEKRIESIAFPRLGCGNGGLNWDDVKPIMEHYLKGLPIPIYIYIGNYSDCTPEYLEPLPMEEWIHANPSAIGYAAVEEDLKKVFRNTRVVQLENGERDTAIWVTKDQQQGIKVINGVEEFVSSDELCMFWNYLRDVGIIDEKKIPTQFVKHAGLLIQALKCLDYLQPVLTSQDGIDFDLGYQYARSDVI